MFNSAILDVVIGLIFVFILMSTLCAAVREGIETWLKTRAAYLEFGIRELLHDAEGNGLAKALYEHPLISSLYVGTYEESKTDNLRPSTVSKGKKLPSYIPASNFARALIDIAARGPVDLTEDKPIPGSTTFDPVTLATLRSNIQTYIPNSGVQRVLLLALDSSTEDLAKVQTSIEAWYDSGMDRVSGWYKRSTQLVLFLIGLVLAVALNVNTITIGEYLSRNEDARNAIVEKAKTAAAAQANKNNAGDAVSATESYKKYDQALQELGHLNLPIGWSGAFDPIHKDDPNWSLPAYVGTSIIGWLLTALAATLGAPFWFDVLNKVMVIRSTVKPHEKSPEEPSQDSRPGSGPSTSTPANGGGPGPGAGGAGGAAGGGAGGAGGAAGAAASDEDEDPDGDGCLCDHDIEDETLDENLPKADGGVA